MSRRDNSDLRCPNCRMHDALCVCALIPRLETRSRLHLIIHFREERKTTNTGRLAVAALVNSEVQVRGNLDQPDVPLVFAPDTQPLLLFPYDDARPLTDFAASPRPVTLIVPDGNWRQAARVHKRVPGLADVPRVALPPGPRSRYRLRAEPHRDGLATLEAIARAMGILEGPAVQQALEKLFVVMVERTLWSRGRLPTAQVSGGIPEGALRHAPGFTDSSGG